MTTHSVTQYAVILGKQYTQWVDNPDPCFFSINFSKIGRQISVTEDITSQRLKLTRRQCFAAVWGLLMLTVVSGSALHVAINSSCHDTVAQSSVVGRFLLQVRQPGTRCQTISVISRSAKTSGGSGVYILGGQWGGHNCSWRHGPILLQRTTPNKW